MSKLTLLDVMNEAIKEDDKPWFPDDEWIEIGKRILKELKKSDLKRKYDRAKQE